MHWLNGCEWRVYWMLLDKMGWFLSEYGVLMKEWGPWVQLLGVDVRNLDTLGFEG